LGGITWSPPLPLDTPPDDADYSSRWKAIKIPFAKAIPSTEYRSRVRRAGERDSWQRRFWEHTIRDEDDYVTHRDDVHINPIKHDLVARVGDWPYSTFHRYGGLGLYPKY